jgi:hypothetical protein
LSRPLGKALGQKFLGRGQVGGIYRSDGQGFRVSLLQAFEPSVRLCGVYAQMGPTGYDQPDFFGSYSDMPRLLIGHFMRGAAKLSDLTIKGRSLVWIRGWALAVRTLYDFRQMIHVFGICGNS